MSYYIRELQEMVNSKAAEVRRLQAENESLRAQLREATRSTTRSLQEDDDGHDTALAGAGR